MSEHDKVAMDGNEAVASTAIPLNETMATYPMAPDLPRGERADEGAVCQRPNIWRSVAAVVEMRSEPEAAGAGLGALSAGSLSTTFTASQGLRLLIPNRAPRRRKGVSWI